MPTSTPSPSTTPTPPADAPVFNRNYAPPQTAAVQRPAGYGCNGCVFDGAESCWSTRKCNENERPDGARVIFVWKGGRR